MGELSACFEIGKECDVFRDEAELLDKVQYYISHPQERREIAVAGQRRALSEHLFSHRIDRLVELLREAGVLPRTRTSEGPPVSVPRIRIQGPDAEPALSVDPTPVS